LVGASSAGGCPRDYCEVVCAATWPRNSPALRAAFGHKDLGVYLVTRKSGEVVIGAPVKAPRGDAVHRLMRPTVLAAVNGHRRFICRGCYFVYEEAHGLPQQEIPPGTDFGRLRGTWQCPDCGTEKGKFRRMWRRSPD
jgi:GntR family transcriptional regulator / MocR family aminotransferase